MILEILKFIVYSILIIIVAKFILVETIRSLAENLNLKAKTIGNITGFATSIPELLTITSSTSIGLIRYKFI